jgi:predicted nucleic acid-binding protein
MSKIFYDTTLFIYLLEGNPLYVARVQHLLARSRSRGDMLFTSHFAVGEVLAGVHRPGASGVSASIWESLERMTFQLLTFDAGAVDSFGQLRGFHKIKIADSINLACAASAGIDLFLTGDKQLMKLNVPGIQFIADFENPII